MKRNFNTLMKCIGVVAGCATIFACTEINELEERVDSLDNRITALETQLPALNQSIDAINKIIQDGSVITSLEYIVPEDENQEPYYEFTLSNDAQTYRLVNGSVGNIPTIGINENGNWTLTTEDGITTEILVNGEPASAKAIVPEFEIDSEGYWTISTNDGENFTRVLNSEGQPVLATGTEGSDIFDNVEYVEAEGVLRITMAGSDTPIEVRVISAEEFSCIIMYEGAKVDYDTPIEFGLGNVMNFNVSMTGVVTSIISKPEGWSAVLGDPANGTAVLTVTAPATMTPVTRISASTENDITIHAINEEGLSIFAKMQVKLLPGEKPSISVSAVDANSYTSVSFNLADAQDMTSYKYLLYNADSPAPTEASFANATEVTSENPVTPLVLTETSDGTTVLYNESYTLYVMPVNTTTEGYVINGDIEQATASTLVPSTYAELYEAGVPISIGGKTYTHDEYGDAAVLSGDITTAPATPVCFIDGNANINYGSSTSELILIGNSFEEKASLTFTNYLRLVPTDGTEDILVFNNLDISADAANTNNYFCSMTADGVFENICIDNCNITLNKHFITINNGPRVFSNLVISDSKFFVTEGAQQRNIIGTNNNNTITAESITIENNIFYSTNAGNSEFKMIHMQGLTVNSLSIKNNTFYNLEGSDNADMFIRFYTINDIEVTRNIFVNEVFTHARNIGFIRCQNGPYPTSGNVSENIAYSAVDGRVCNLFYDSGNYTSTIMNFEQLDTNPLSEINVETGTFIPNSTYSSYGAQQ